MNLSIKQAADRLGKTERQIRYLIQTDRLPARKEGGRWQIAAGDLPLSDGQQRAQVRKQAALRTAVETALELPERGRRRYSVQDLKAFQISRPVYDRCVEQLGQDHPASLAVRQVLDHLTRGCHRYESADKAAAYRQARDAASLAVTELLLSDDPGDAAALAGVIEQELMAALAGLLRRLERRQRR